MKIHSTTNYNQFIPPPHRQINELKVQAIAASMRVHGYIKKHHIIVREAASGLEIVSGYHRLLAAAHAGVAVSYEIDNDFVAPEQLELELAHQPPTEGVA